MAWRCRFMSASEVPKSTQKLVQPVVVAGLRRVSARHPAGSLRSTETTDDDKLRRGAATDLMGEVGGAFVAPWVVPMAGGGSPCGHHVGFGEDDSPPPSPACPEHPAISNATAFDCAPRVVSLRSERTKKSAGKRNSWMPGHLLGVVTARWERNPQIPEPPRTPHLTSDRPAWWSWVLPRAQPPARRSAMPRRRQREPKDARDKVKLAVASRVF